MGSGPFPTPGFNPLNVHFKLTMNFIALFIYLFIFAKKFFSITSKYYFPNISSIATGPPAFSTYFNKLVTPAAGNIVCKEFTEWRWSIFAYGIISKLSKNWWIFSQKNCFEISTKIVQKQKKGTYLGSVRVLISRLFIVLRIFFIVLKKPHLFSFCPNLKTALQLT